MKVFKKIFGGCVLAMGCVFSGAAFAGSATVTMGGKSYSLSKVTCFGGPESFNIQAQEPDSSVRMELAAVSGDVKSVGFRAGDMMAQVADKTGLFDGKTFSFEGEAQVFTTSSINRKKINVSVTCDD